MKDAHDSDRHLMQKGGRLLGHTIAIVAGIVLVILGLGLGVTMVGLPVGLPMGLAGILLCMWGLYFGAPSKRT